MPQVLRELRYDEGLTQDWSWKGPAECQRWRSVLQPPSCFCITSPWTVTQFKITVGIRAQFLNGMLAANTQFCQHNQSNYAASMGQWEPFCRSICTCLPLLRDAHGAEMISFALIFKIVYMMMSKGSASPSSVIIPLCNWKNVDSRNIKKPICIYNLISYE